MQCDIVTQLISLRPESRNLVFWLLLRYICILIRVFSNLSKFKHLEEREEEQIIIPKSSRRFLLRLLGLEDLIRGWKNKVHLLEILIIYLAIPTYFKFVTYWHDYRTQYVSLLLSASQWVSYMSFSFIFFKVIEIWMWNSNTKPK